MSVDTAALMARMKKAVGVDVDGEPVHKEAFMPAPPPAAMAPPAMDPAMMAGMMSGMAPPPAPAGAMPGMPGAGSMAPPDAAAMMGVSPDMLAAMGGAVPGVGAGLPPGVELPAEPMSPDNTGGGGEAPPAGMEGAPPAEEAPLDIPPEIRAVVREELEAMLAEKGEALDPGGMVALRSQLEEALARIEDMERLLADQGIAAAPLADQAGAVSALPETLPGGEELPPTVGFSDLPPGFADLDMGGAPEGAALPMKTASASHHWGSSKGGSDPYVD